MSWFEVLPGLVLLHAIMATVAVTMGILAHRQRLRHMAFGLLCAVAIMQTGVVVQELTRVGIWAWSRPVYLEGLTWLLAVTSLVLWRNSRMHGLVLILAPFTLFTAILAATQLGGGMAPPKTSVVFFSIHVGCVFAALALMAVAFGAGLFFMVQERVIKSKGPLTAFHRELPALSGLDRINAVTTWAGFPIYSLGLLFGMVAARLTWGSVFTGDPKELVSLGVWALYAVLFHQRLAHGWQGRKPAVLAVSIFAAALFSLFVVNTFMTTHHSFFAS